MDGRQQRERFSFREYVHLSELNSGSAAARNCRVIIDSPNN